MVVEKVAVIGAGIIGRGIAHVAALGGYHVKLNDISEELLDKAINLIKREMEKGIDLGKVTRAQLEEALQKIKLTTDINVHIPTQNDHPFQSKTTTDSNLKRPPVLK